jgi:2,3-bisphosphoglycerate-independent phosphoglycerate mutase
VLLEDDPRLKMRTEGKLADIAPTILDLWRLEKPAVMTGESLVLG